MAVTADRARMDPLAHVRQDQTTFEATFMEHYPRVFGVLFRLVGDRVEAEDLTLETFWRLWQRPPEDHGQLGAWLYRVALRLGFNALRAARRRAGYEEAAVRAALEREPGPDPPAEAERADELGRVRETLRRMAPRDAQLLVLRHSGLRYGEIAAALGVAPASVGTLLARAEQEFARRYERAQGG